MKASLKLVAVLALLVVVPARAEKARVVVLGITSDSNLSALADSLAEQVLTELQHDGQLEVIGTSDVKALLGAERQRQLLGCSEGSCMVEISAALGAPWLVGGSLAQAGQTMRFDLKLIDARQNKVVFRDGVIIKNHSETFDLVSGLVRRLLPFVGERPAVSLGPAITIGGGAVVAAAGGLMIGLGAALRSNTLNALSQPANTLLNDVPTYGDARANLQSAQTQVVLGSIVAAVGLTALFAGLTWKLTPPTTPGLVVSLALGPGAVNISGAFE